MDRKKLIGIAIPLAVWAALIAIPVPTGLAPAAWLLARSERLVTGARARERLAHAGLALLAEAPALACAAAAGARDDGEVTLRWTASGDTLRTVVAHAAHRALGVADTLVTTVACP